MFSIVAVGAKASVNYYLTFLLMDIFLRASYKTGKYIYEKVAPKMVPCQCELGGKDPLYVADDINDIKATAAATADGLFIIMAKLLRCRKNLRK
jgi:hypothetical protein